MALERERSRGQRDPYFYFIEFLVLVDSFSFLLASDIILVHRAQGCLVFLKRNCIFILLHFPFFFFSFKEYQSIRNELLRTSLFFSGQLKTSSCPCAVPNHPI